MGTKRSRADMEGRPGRDGPGHGAAAQPSSPYMPMFEHFRAELDEHHDRRERVIKASRDITAASKKIIFTLQRIRAINQPVPTHVRTTNAKHHDTINKTFASVSPDLQGLNAHRYGRQISGGCQEWMESASFQHYLETGQLISYEEAATVLRDISRAPAKTEHDSHKMDVDDAHAGESGAGVMLSPEDYVLGIYDMTGELMRFAITTMATNGSLPTVSAAQHRNVLTDMRELRSALESLDVGTGPFAKDVDKKMDVMKTSVEKVEKALYGLTVRGAERPKGWLPDTSDGVGVAA